MLNLSLWCDTTTQNFDNERHNVAMDNDKKTPSKALGYALYLEFRRDTHTNQMLITPPLVDIVTKTPIPPYVISRMVSAQHSRRTWRYKGSTQAVGTLNSARTGYEEVGESEALELASELLKTWDGYLNSMEDGGWTLYKEPLVVEITGDDVVDIKTASDAPKALLRRVGRARTEAGFEAAVFATA